MLDTSCGAAWGHSLFQGTLADIRQYDIHPDLPLGPPQLMMALTSDKDLEGNADHQRHLAEMDE
jgi:hypothetical protein